MNAPALVLPGARFGAEGAKVENLPGQVPRTEEQVELEEDQRGAIEPALASVESLLAGRENGDAVTATQLREANSKLDAATQPLAGLMMDRVMAEMLEKRGVLPG